MPLLLLNHHLTNFQQHLSKQELSLHTIRGYFYDLRHFLTWLETLHIQREFRLADITAIDLRAYRQHMVSSKRQKPAAVNRRIQALKRFFTWAVQQELLREDPSQETRFMRKQPPSQPRALTKGEVILLLSAAGRSSHGLAKRNLAVLQLALQAGLRIGEIIKLQCRDLNIKKRSGTVRILEGKGFKERTVPLNTSARQALSAYLTDRENLETEESVFISKRKLPATIRGMQLIITNLARKAKITRLPVSAHTLRHTFALNYLKANPGNLVELASMLGHESLDTTAIYTKASKEKLAEGVERSELNIYDG
jgi:site-specific recombinase XerD